MKIHKYPISTLLVVTPQKGIFHPHPEICIVSDYDKPDKDFMLNGGGWVKEWLGLYPYNRDAFKDRCLSTIGTSPEASKYYVAIEDGANKFVQPYLYQFKEPLVYKSTGSIWEIDRIDFESKFGRIGRTSKFQISNPKGFLFYMVPQDKLMNAHWITRGELEKNYTLI